MSSPEATPTPKVGRRRYSGVRMDLHVCRLPSNCTMADVEEIAERVSVFLLELGLREASFLIYLTDLQYEDQQVHVIPNLERAGISVIYSAGVIRRAVLSTEEVLAQFYGEEAAGEEGALDAA